MERHIEIASFEAAAADPYAQFESQDILVLLRIIAELEENATAQALALKAAKAMQQAETERAGANERDAERYRILKSKVDQVLENL